jgi:hypothetical protein
MVIIFIKFLVLRSSITHVVMLSVVVTSCCSINSSISCAYEICCTIFTQQVRALSRACVDRVVSCLLALECLQLVMNLLQYAMTLLSFLSLEYHCAMSSGG